MCMSFRIATFAVTIISFLVCLFWLQKRGWHFVASATNLPSLSFPFWYVFSDYKRHLLSLSFPFWYVFSDYKRGDDISSHPPPICNHYHFLFGMSFLTTKEGMTFRRIRHHHVYVFSDCTICHHYHFLFGMSFLTTKEGMTFRRIRHHHVYVFSDCRPAAGNMAATLKKTWPCWRLGSGVREMLG